MKTVTIQDVEFHIRPFDAFRQLRLFGDLQKEVLPSVGGVLNVALSGRGEGTAIDEVAVIEAFRDLCSRFDGATLERWANALLDADHISCTLPGRREPEKMDKIARGMALADFSSVLELMYQVGKVNFADPLARWASLSGLAQKLTAKLSASSAPTSSTNS